jgi:stage IV sporulation protein FB
MSILDCPDSTRGEWRFQLFGIAVRVQPLFWVTTVFMASNRDPGGVLIWIAVCFLSILVHELGHVFAFKAFGQRAEVVLYSWGGLAVPKDDVRMGTFAETAVSLAGPFAGFCLAGLVVGAGLLAGVKFHVGFHMLVIPSVTASAFHKGMEAMNYLKYYYWNVLLNDLLFVNIFWGLVNLLPVYPLDGGRAARALFVDHDPVLGRRRALKVSIGVALAVAVLGLVTRSMYLVAMFGILAAGSVQMLEAEKTIFRPYESWRR